MFYLYKAHGRASGISTTNYKPTINLNRLLSKLTRVASKFDLLLRGSLILSSYEMTRKLLDAVTNHTAEGFNCFLRINLMLLFIPRHTMRMTEYDILITYTYTFGWFQGSM